MFELRRERDKLEEYYNILWYFVSAFVEYVFFVIGRRGSVGFLEEEEDGGYDDNWLLFYKGGKGGKERI